ncbi:hypothetical protein [Deminuibacter soli]|uniref:DUF4595 domain-containing protein n=1 Tax=Deminuibacter soli TaxID=2291815 RepID=A0A3E1NLB7_9BACT|nr:hypothetical protein [Deminuibacter soli]RFM28729.1 hypothetical protein DXN05_08080 [Deminuibacter soli]
MSVLPVIVLLTLLYAGCSKKDSTTDPAVNLTPRNCNMLSVAQQNNGSKGDLSISFTFDDSSRATSLLAYDSAVGVQLGKYTFTYSKDTIRIDSRQYFLTDSKGRVRRFHTQDDPHDSSTDVYDYEYLYNDSGFLVTKNQYVNGAKQPDYTTTYTYRNNVLTHADMVVPGANNILIFSATLNYMYEQDVQNWLYHFPDGTESYLFQQCLNFGRKSQKALKSVITQVFNGNNTVADQWTTNYGSYVFSTEGNIMSVTATGDEQQGFAFLYGRTFFNYQCK